MNKQELIERIKRLDESYLKAEFFLKLIEQLDEPEKVQIPQFVAEHIEHSKEIGRDLQDAMNSSLINKQVDQWLYTKNNMETFARAWLDGYEVEEEKRYIVRVKGVEEDNAFLNYYAPRNEWFMDSSCDMKDIRAFHTRKQLEEADFGWVFSCEGIEIEEVE